MDSDVNTFSGMDLADMISVNPIDISPDEGLLTQDTVCLDCWGLSTYMHEGLGTQKHTKHREISLDELILRCEWTIPEMSPRLESLMQEKLTILKSQIKGWKQLLSDMQLDKAKYQDIAEHWSEYSAEDEKALQHLQRVGKRCIPRGKSVWKKLDSYAEEISGRILELRTVVHTYSAQCILDGMETTLINVATDRQDHISKKMHQITRDITYLNEMTQTLLKREIQILMNEINIAETLDQFCSHFLQYCKMRKAIMKTLLKRIASANYRKTEDGKYIFLICDLLTEVLGVGNRVSWNRQILQCEHMQRVLFNELYITGPCPLFAIRKIDPMGSLQKLDSLWDAKYSNMIGNSYIVAKTLPNDKTSINIVSFDMKNPPLSNMTLMIVDGPVSRPYLTFSKSKQGMQLHFYSESEHSIMQYMMSDDYTCTKTHEYYSPLNEPMSLDFSDLSRVFELDDSGEIIVHNFLDNTEQAIFRALEDTPSAPPPVIEKLIPIEANPKLKKFLLCSDEENNVWSVTSSGNMALVKSLDYKCISAMIIEPLKQGQSILSHLILIDELGNAYYRGRVFHHALLFGDGALQPPATYIASTPTATIFAAQDTRTSMLTLFALSTQDSS